MNKNNYKKILTILFGIILFFPSTSSASLVNKTITQTLTSGLVGHWTMDQKDATWSSDTVGTILDKSGNGYTGTFTNMSRAASQIAGKIGQAFKFDGSNDYVALTNGIASNLSGGKFTLTAWIKPNVITGSSGGTIIKNWGSLNPGAFHFDVASSKLRLFIQEADTSVIGPLNDATNLSTGVWQHVVAIADGSFIRIYRDGVSVGTPIAYDGTLYTSFTYTNIGVKPGDSGGADVANPGYLDGLLDDVRIYNRALSATEVAQLYNLGASKFNATPTLPLTSGLVGHWTMDGKDTVWTSSTAGTVVDKSGNGNTGTLTNMARATSSIAGKIGQALKFDGTLATNQYITTTFTTALTDFTACAWFYPRTPADSGYHRVMDKSYVNGFWIGNNLGTSNWGGGIRQSTSPYGLYVAVSPYNSWHHICNQRSGTTQNIILDGGASTATQTVSGTALDTTALWIGTSVAVTSDYMYGYIDDVRVYNRALSSTEISQLYQLGASKFNATSTQPLTSGLVGHFTFDGKDSVWTDATTGTVIDKSGNGNTGTFTNMARATAPVVGKIGQGVKFDERSDRVTMGDVSAYDFSGSFSVAFWIKTTQVSTGEFITILGKGYLDGVNGFGFYIYNSFDNAIRMQTRTSGTVVAARSNATISNGVWQHVVGVRDHSANTTTLYINGTAQTDVGTGALTDYTSTRAFNIGDDYENVNPPATVDGFIGSIDDVRLYNRALSATEIEQLYNMGR